jgi:hypothetical protein
MKWFQLPLVLTAVLIAVPAFAGPRMICTWTDMHRIGPDGLPMFQYSCSGNVPAVAKSGTRTVKPGTAEYRMLASGRTSCQLVSVVGVKFPGYCQKL